MASSGKHVAYYRVSTARQGRSGLGLEAQKKAVAEYLNGGDWKIVGEFTEVESGKRADRPHQRKLSRCAACTGRGLLSPAGDAGAGAPRPFRSGRVKRSIACRATRISCVESFCDGARRLVFPAACSSLMIGARSAALAAVRACSARWFAGEPVPGSI
jgi:hypothetical protein